MTNEQFEEMMMLLTEIKDLIKEKQSNQQPQTKITVVGNKVQTNTKGLKNNEDFIL